MAWDVAYAQTLVLVVVVKDVVGYSFVAVIEVFDCKSSSMKRVNKLKSDANVDRNNRIL